MDVPLLSERSSPRAGVQLAMRQHKFAFYHNCEAGNDEATRYVTLVTQGQLTMRWSSNSGCKGNKNGKGVGVIKKTLLKAKLSQ
jgi:hypothetical protein